MFTLTWCCHVALVLVFYSAWGILQGIITALVSNLNPGGRAQWINRWIISVFFSGALLAVAYWAGATHFLQ
jgi:hypothetical protein